MSDARRLDAPAVERRLARIDELLEHLQGVPGPTSEAAITVVQALTEVYGEALARVRDLGGPALAAALAGDELLGHLLVLHDLHPDPLDRRVAAALDALRPALRERGGDVEPAGIDGAVATVRLRLKGCGSSSGAVEEAVREAVLAAGPELSEVRLEPSGDAPAPAFVPLDALVRPSGSACGVPA
ncbi:NifU family protein [Streptomyces sp. HPF1205]|uniref:NifU family protein n=1 Tax=Streptomyces sp. HPF1205 TaxID=2873262 RepID=UPI001CEDDCB9|nr:NifU family protein [Streptomyces sp. HPF1205]